jgi:flagellar motility protein MotE (MotC chaperone)
MTGAEKSTYSAFERFLIWFFIPLVFTTVLLGVLLSIFDYDVKNSVLRLANQIPLVHRIVPDVAESGNAAVTPGTAQDTPLSLQDEVQRLNQRIADQEAELKQVYEANREKDRNIEELKAQIAALEEQLKGKTVSEEEYNSKIQQLAATYASMTPSKAAPIIEKLTLHERVLVLGAMRTDDRVKILEKMDPKIAAETTILLKDTVPVKDTEIAALQERLKQYELASSNDPEKLSSFDLGNTFAGMTPQSAAVVLVEMMKSNQPQVVAIMKAMDTQARSRILTAMADVSKESAAAITAEMGQ